MGNKLESSKQILSTVPFNVEELDISQDGKMLSHPYYRICCQNWVSILPVTSDNQAILIRQFRAGSLTDTLEVPGGVIDDHERDPTMAALRELEEETGFTSSRLMPLASINPNPAIQNNIVHMFIALNCSLNPNRTHFPDEHEEIEVILKPLSELDMMVRTNQINHGIAALTIMLGQKYTK